MSGLAFAEGSRFAEMFATAPPAAAKTVPLSDAMMVVLSLVALYFLVALIELCLDIKDNVMTIKDRLMSLNEKSEPLMGDGKAEEQSAGEKIIQELKNMKHDLAVAVKEVPMIAILVFFAHVRVRSDLGYTIASGQYPAAMKTVYWIVAAAIFVKASFALITAMCKLCMMGWDLGMNCIDVTKMILAFLAEIGVVVGVVFLVIQIVTTPKFGA